jgi:hypothetical protein
MQGRTVTRCPREKDSWTKAGEVVVFTSCPSKKDSCGHERSRAGMESFRPSEAVRARRIHANRLPRPVYDEVSMAKFDQTGDDA